MTAFIICLSLINVILWVIFFIRFKKLFSTDKIIEKTSEKMNKMIADIDNATDRDLFLAKESTKRIQNMLDEAEKRMEIFREATQRLREMIAEADKITKKTINKSPIYNNVEEVIVKKDEKVPVRKNINAYIQNSYNSNSRIDPDNVYKVVQSEQMELFEDNNNENEDKMYNQNINVTIDGAAYKEVPLIITKVLEDNPVEQKNDSKKNLNKKVQELYNNGLKIEEIANELSCSITEVQLIIDMSL